MQPRKPSAKPRGNELDRLASVGVVVYSRQYRNALLGSLEGKDGIIPFDLGDGSDESLRRLVHVRPQAVLVDVPKGRMATLLRVIHAQHPTVALLAMNCDESETELLALFEAGLTGFVPHDAGPEDLICTIRDAIAGEFHCPPRIAAALVRRVNAAGDVFERNPVPTALTARETQIARLVERSLTNKEIASRLGLEVSTVRNHVYSICRKLDAHRRGEIAARLGTPPLLIIPARRRRRDRNH